MSSAIIGYTGFVGSNLVRQKEFNSFYNSKNIHSIIGKSFDLVVCSGAPAVKWLANKEPVKDRDNLQILINCLSQISAKKLILISTVDVYPLPIEVDEDTKIDQDNLHPYGKNRLELENFVKDNFDSLIVRLPGLFGKGLKKNVKEVASGAFSFEFTNRTDTAPVKYDFRTKYNHIFGFQDGYIRSKEQVIQDLKEFVSH